MRIFTWSLIGLLSALFLVAALLRMLYPITVALLYILPLIFLFAVLIQMIVVWRNGRKRNEAPRIPTEPLVLMALGFWFLYLNAEFVPLVARVAREQLLATHPQVSLSIVDMAFGVAAIVLMGSFAKAAWTHLNLEEERWGSIDKYRSKIWPNRFVSSIEFGLRVAIAVFVVLLQKQIANLHAVRYIESAKDWSFPNGEFVEFLFAYNKWLAETALWGLALFGCICLWLGIAGWANRNHNSWKSSFYGTLSFAVPGLVICYALKYLSTGSFDLSPAASAHPNFELLMFFSGLVLGCAVIIIGGIIYTLCGAFQSSGGSPPSNSDPREAATPDAPAEAVR